MDEHTAEVQGQKLLSAVERIVEDPDSLAASVEKLERENPSAEDRDPDAHTRSLAERLVSSYSTKTAISGGVAALPAFLPGAGTLVAFLGGGLADLGLMLKFETEMAMALTHLYGFDIRKEKERQIAFLLASVSTYDAKDGRNYFADLIEAEGTAIWNYAPRQISKLLLTAMGRFALMSVSKGFLRALPVVGVVVGSAANKVLTTNVGNRCISELERRRRLEREEQEPVVRSRVQD